MVDAVMHERVSCVATNVAACGPSREATKSEALVFVLGFNCFACGGGFSVRTGDFLRCAVCCAENYCPRTNTPVEDRVHRWFYRRGFSLTASGAT